MKPAAKKPALKIVAASDAVEVDRWQWTQIIASQYGPASATTRHVLHVLALHMGPAGGNCYPGQSTIAQRAGLTRRAVKIHLGIAKRSQWISVTAHRFHVGRGWRCNSYVATIPAALFPLILQVRGGERDSPPSVDKPIEVGNDIHQGGEPGSPEWGMTFPPIKSLNLPSNMQRQSAAPPAVDKSRSTASKKSKPDDLKNRSEKGRALRARIGSALEPPAAKHQQRRDELTDAELLSKMRQLRGIGQSEGDIRRTLGGRASSAQLTRVMKLLRR